jgi:hypothetical protein
LQDSQDIDPASILLLLLPPSLHQAQNCSARYCRHLRHPLLPLLLLLLLRQLFTDTP